MNLYTILKGLLTVTPKNDIRNYLNGVYFTPNEIITSDGHILIRVAYETGVIEPVIYSRESVDLALRRFTKKDEKLLICDGSLVCGSLNVPIIEIVAQYPNIEKDFTNDALQTEGHVSVALLEKATKAIRIIQDKKANHHDGIDVSMAIDRFYLATPHIRAVVMSMRKK